MKRISMYQNGEYRYDVAAKTITERGENMIRNCLSTLTQYIAHLTIPAGGHVKISIG